MFRPWRSFPLMVVTGLALGLLLGPSPVYPKELATVALVVAMTIALTEIRLKDVSIRHEARPFGAALFWNYGVLTALILGIAVLTPDEDLRAGWVAMAAVPTAIAVVPLTSVFRGNTKSALVSIALLYVAALALFPAITLVFAGRAASPVDIGVQTFLQIGVPLLASRLLLRLPGVDRWRPVGVNLTFLVLVTLIAGANRWAFGDLGLVLALSGAGVLRTFGIGLAIYGVATLLRRSREDRIAWTLFGSFKNLGLTALLAYAIFGDAAAVPAIVTLFYEIAWIVALQRVFRA